ncbi:3,2-trans-enoyl-CoA isomerase, mitochondrial precursor, putative [Coccidioides posadasii C735 delta SOWgp]|uniref:Enoyl-CoA hydratase/isomerase n=2 Tax=Coccidioides posadasii TaxID=199306 RepID=A0A0J6FG62_COCPO|nr:3,2-trans-enoyl-CoA isomerase, mitochondrial precursor, putative [Coccidioides posadasii C735 delta SOWgp]EER27917.1 3,2-trans-enoyl-CoA isomerase, mitochondrial precursor, putative [Coccidioides posadasii C735 delta SOWgp]KMM67889.1 enoyl-CoA hydratase/isomerase [Coccidioides posadasii RMSCC 3488]|eukprot:XP_003070062.1 3,2-trans-enoyl-CoA isomerase, mitochondrial precursor, putative [Coccidioides posadasii C735 delta SOWgp]
MSLFTIPIAMGGSFECTSPADRVYLLSFDSPPDNRQTTAFIDAFSLALDIIEEKYPIGVVVTTSKIPKFYSNGLDLEHAMGTEDFFAKVYWPFWKKLLTYPMPTVALINGHAYAGGLFVSLLHDYRFQNPTRGYLCLNEVHFGAWLPAPMASIVKQKVANPAAVRDLITAGRRFDAKEALSAGIIDATGGIEVALKFIEDRSLVKLGQTKVYASLKEEIYKETLKTLESYEENEKERLGRLQERDDMEKVRSARVGAWEKTHGGSKL